MPAIQETLDERQKTHGSFEGHAKISQRLKDVMKATDNWAKLSNVQREGLEMVQHKIARLLNGDHMYVDAMRDIVGYAELMQQSMTATAGATDSQTRKIKLVDGEWVLS